jgi:hypothetical protein
MSASPITISASPPTTAEIEEIVSIGHILLPTLAPIPGDHDSPAWEAKQEKRNKTFEQGLAILKQLHEAYSNVSLDSNISEYGSSVFPMTPLAEAQTRAVMNAIYNLSYDDQLILFSFCNALPPKANDFCWIHDNINQQKKKTFTVAPQAWIIRAGCENIGKIMRAKPTYPSLYHALSRTDELWREKEKNNQKELNGMFWLGRMVEKWGHELLKIVVLKVEVEGQTKIWVQ